MSNRVQGARLKAAAATHARKQLGALGVSVATKAGGATFNGKQAYAYWSIDGEEVRSYGINYPAMPDNALVSRREADLISAYTLHEIGHIAFTDNKAASGAKPIIFHLWNGIEDARIEHAVIASGRAAGARSAFKRLMSKYTAAASPSFNPCNINAAPFALALVCRAAFGDGNGFAKTLLDRIPEPKRSLYANCADRAKGLTLDRNGSWGAFALAREFLDGWLAIEPDALKAPEPIQPPPGAPQPEQQQEQQEQQEADDADSAPSSFEERDSDDQGADDDNSGNSGFDWDDDGEDGNADQGADVDLDADMDSDADAGGGDGEDDGISAADLQRDMEESAEDVSNARDDSVLFDQSEDEHDESGDGDGYSGADTFDDEQATFDEGSVIKAEPDVDDVFQQILERTKAPIDLPPVASVRRTFIRNWSTVTELDAAGQRRHYRNLHKSALPALKAQLYRILKAPERCGWDGGALGGRFDGKRTSRMMAGSECVFKRRWVSEGINTAVSIVIDMSSSMKGEAMKQSVELGWTVAEAAESAGCEVEVVGFTTKYSSVAQGGFTLNSDWVGSEVSRSSHSATLVVAKRWQDKCANSAQYFSIMKRAAEGGTPDYSAIRTVAEQLSTHKAQRKLVIVITDGCGEVHHMKALTESAFELYGVDIIGFGIGIDPWYFAKAYSLGAAVGNDLMDLHKTCLKSVADQLAQRDFRRVA